MLVSSCPPPNRLFGWTQASFSQCDILRFRGRPQVVSTPKLFPVRGWTDGQNRVSSRLVAVGIRVVQLCPCGEAESGVGSKRDWPLESNFLCDAKLLFARIAIRDGWCWDLWVVGVV